MSDPHRELHLNAFLMEAGHHEAAWRLPRATRERTSTCSTGSGSPSSPRRRSSTRCSWPTARRSPAPAQFRPPGQLEPFTLLTALSQHTSRIGLIATVSSTYNEPYNLARRLASVDHVSGRPGRLEHRDVSRRRRGAPTSASTTVPTTLRATSGPTSSSTSPRRCGTAGRTMPSSPTRKPGATPTRRGCTPSTTWASYFRVAGPLNVERPPQGHPLLVQAGSSEDGKDFAARHAEAIFTAHQTYERAADFYRDIKARASAAAATRTGSWCCRASCRSSARPRPRPPSWPGSSTSSASPSTGCAQLAWTSRGGARRCSSSTRRCPTSSSPARNCKARRAGRTSSSSWRCGRTSRCGEILSRLGGGRGHFTFVGTPEQAPTRSSPGSRAVRLTVSTSWRRVCRCSWRTSSSTCCRSCAARGSSARSMPAPPCANTTASTIPANQFRVDA